LSALGLDAVGARATNLTNTGRREDLYTEVANSVKAIVSKRAAAGEPAAVAWLGKVERNTVKRAVMTTPYGVTREGIRTQLQKDGRCKGVEGVSQNEAAGFMTSVIIEALDSTVVESRKIMKYFQSTARVLAESNIPLVWETPMGMRVQQAYYPVAPYKVKTLWGETRRGSTLLSHIPGAKLSAEDQALAAAPNVVHSLDASHLASTVLRAYNERQICDFAMVHDSYATHARYVDELGMVLRQCFVEMYSDNWLEEFDACVREYAPPDVKLPSVPTRGTFNISEVLDSPYFFS
jgi:DNA-directed RNA polymerase